MNGGDLAVFLGGCVAPSLVLSWLFALLVRKQAAGWGLVDKPGEAHKTHGGATPLGGGLAIFTAVLAPLLVGQVILIMLAWNPNADWLPVPQFALAHISGATLQTPKLWMIVAAAASLTLLGLADDRFGVHWGVRLAIQLVIAALFVLVSGIRLTAFIPVDAVQVVLTVLWIVALVNAFNMLDNMNGLSAGVAVVCAASLAAAMLISPDPQTGSPQLFVAGLSLVVLGSLLGFLPHNFPRGKLFMGDAGSYFVGFMLAVLTMLGTYAGYGRGGQHAVLAPLVLLAVPLYDMVSVLWIRLRAGSSPFQADQNHFSHRLVAHGFSHTQSVLVIYLLTAICGVAAIVLRQVSSAGAILVGLMVLCILCLVAVLETRSRPPDGT